MSTWQCCFVGYFVYAVDAVYCWQLCSGFTVTGKYPEPCVVVFVACAYHLLFFCDSKFGVSESCLAAVVAELWTVDCALQQWYIVCCFGCVRLSIVVPVVLRTVPLARRTWMLSGVYTVVAPGSACGTKWCVAPLSAIMLLVE